jgi:hypothetical protein
MSKIKIESSLNIHEDFEIIRDALRLLRTEYKDQRFVSSKWKNDVAWYIQQQLKIYEGKSVKESSIIRNIDRMIAYYEQSGSQARSGKKYLPYLEMMFNEIYQKVYETAHALGGGIAQRFMTLEDALEYKGDIQLLKIVFDPKSKLFVVVRFPSEIARGNVAQQG